MYCTICSNLQSMHFFLKQTLWGYPSSAVHWKWQLYSLSLPVDIICLFMVLAFTRACWFHFSSTQSYLSISNSQRQSPQGAVDEFIYILSVGNKEKKSILQRPLVHTVGSVCMCARAKAQWQSPEALASIAHTQDECGKTQKSKLISNILHKYFLWYKMTSLCIIWHYAFYCKCIFNLARQLLLYSSQLRPVLLHCHPTFICVL